VGVRVLRVRMPGADEHAAVHSFDSQDERIEAELS
jgi:hypothetical protein